ncbi:MAG TPA: STAS domain-containing protein [Anaerolineae bacterium]|nr:STAS domain-containing protein [Anaerolineae bacterium]
MLDIKLKKTDASNMQVLILSGEFDLSDKERVQGFLSEILTEGRRGVIVDLSGITYMEEAGVETLIYYLQELIRIGACMAVIVKPGSRLMNKLDRLGIFDSTGLKVFGSIEEVEAVIKAGKCK